MLVNFEGPATFDGTFGLKDCLEPLRCRSVDLVTGREIKPHAWRIVERDLIRVA